MSGQSPPVGDKKGTVSIKSLFLAQRIALSALPPRKSQSRCNYGNATLRTQIHLESKIIGFQIRLVAGMISSSGAAGIAFGIHLCGFPRLPGFTSIEERGVPCPVSDRVAICDRNCGVWCVFALAKASSQTNRILLQRYTMACGPISRRVAPSFLARPLPKKTVSRPGPVLNDLSSWNQSA